MIRGVLDADRRLARAAGVHGIPILFFPAITGQIQTAQFLLDRGADVNAGAGGNTALHAAALFGQGAMAEWLLAHGADAGATDYDGKTPLARAEERGHAGVAEVLRRAGTA